MQNTRQDTNASTPRRIFPLSPEMVRQLRATSTSQLRKAQQSTQDQKQAA